MTLLLSLLIIFVIIISIAVIFTKKLLHSVIMTSMISAVCVIVYSLLFALDVAITEAACNAAIGTVIILNVMSVIAKDSILKQRSVNQFIVYKKFIVLVSILIMFSIIIFAVNDIKSSINIDSSSMYHFYTKNAVKDFGVNNIVTAILGGYRGFDTLLETFVIAITAIACSAVLDKNENTIVRKDFKK